MELFLGLKGHTNQESLPLRFGFQITETHQQFCNLKDAFYDEAGTIGQRPPEIAMGREHYGGELEIPNAVKTNPQISNFCTVVIQPPNEGQNLSKIITLLRDGSKGDMTVTKHISGMVKRGKITTDDIINYLHPAYIAGKIHDSNDVEDILQAELSRRVKASVITNSKTDELILSSSDQIKAVMESFPIDEVALDAVPTFQKLKLSDKVKYQYSMADAYVEDTWTADGKIWVSVIGSNGAKTDLHSFTQREHLATHHKKTFEYLQSRIGQRAHFAVCMSEPCKGFLAESVTSIALQLMKT